MAQWAIGSWRSNQLLCGKVGLGVAKDNILALHPNYKWTVCIRNFRDSMLETKEGRCMFPDEQWVWDELGPCLKIRCQLLIHRRPERPGPRLRLKHPTSAIQRGTITNSQGGREGQLQNIIRMFIFECNWGANHTSILQFTTRLNIFIYRAQAIAFRQGRSLRRHGFGTLLMEIPWILLFTLYTLYRFSRFPLLSLQINVSKSIIPTLK